MMRKILKFFLSLWCRSDNRTKQLVCLFSENGERQVWLFVGEYFRLFRAIKMYSFNEGILMFQHILGLNCISEAGQLFCVHLIGVHVLA